MKLYELEKGDYFILPAHPNEGTFEFDHVDGLYSFCFDEFDNIVHLAAYVEVQKIDKGNL